MLSGPVPVLAGVVCDHDLGRVCPSLDRSDVAATIRTLLTPEVQRQAIAGVTAYAATTTWAAEAPVLAGVYADCAAGPGPKPRSRATPAP